MGTNPGRRLRVAARAVSDPSMTGWDAGRIDEKEDVVGVLLLNLGGPETLDDVQPFLYNLFADPDIIRLPGVAASSRRSPRSSPTPGRPEVRRVNRRRIPAQAHHRRQAALQSALVAKGPNAKCCVGMRYWKPFTEGQWQIGGRRHQLVVLPLYPQFSISTSGIVASSGQIFGEDDTSQPGCAHGDSQLVRATRVRAGHGGPDQGGAEQAGRSV